MGTWIPNRAGGDEDWVVVMALFKELEKHLKRLPVRASVNVLEWQYSLY